MTRIGRWPPCTTSRPLIFSSSRLPASANSLLGASMSIPPIVALGPLQVLRNIGIPSRKGERMPWFSSSTGRVASIDSECVADYKACAGTAEPKDGRGNLFRSAEPPDRLLLYQFLDGFGLTDPHAR